MALRNEVLNGDAQPDDFFVFGNIYEDGNLVATDVVVPISARSESQGAFQQPQTVESTSYATPPRRYPHLVPVNDAAELEIQQQAPELHPQPRVRVATAADLDALVRIELGAYHDVYGDDPTPVVIDQVTAKYRERVDLLAADGMIRVIETNSDAKPEVYGMIVCAQTNLEADTFLASGGAMDMTQNANILASYDPNGKNGYIVNLAVLPGHGPHDGQLLMQDAIGMGVERGVERVFFESRLPGLERWLVHTLRNEGDNRSVGDLSEAEMHSYADTYWRLTRDNGQPRDPLLAYYVRGVETSLGEVHARPLGLIEEAWKPDRPSAGYGVLCELELPGPNREDQSLFDSAIPVSESTPLLGREEATQRSFAQRTAESIRRNKWNIAMLGTVAVAAAFLHANGQEAELMQRMQGEAKPWVVAWGGNLALYAASWAAMGLSGAMYAGEKLARKVEFVDNHVPQTAWERLHRINTAMFKALYRANAAFALMAAGAFTGAVATGIPEGQAQIVGYAAAAIDVYSTVASRVALGRMFLNHSQQQLVES